MAVRLARGDAAPNSDYDLAVALHADVANTLEARAQLLDDLAFGMSTVTELPVSCVDINRIPVPLAANIIEQGRVLFCRSDVRLRAEQQRVWSLWEAYKYEHERNRTAL